MITYSSNLTFWIMEMRILKLLRFSLERSTMQYTRQIHFQESNHDMTRLIFPDMILTILHMDKKSKKKIL